jgi:hypothetical protein
MDMKTRITEATKAAMKEKDAGRLSTLRLIAAAMKDREIALRTEGAAGEGLPETEALALLGKMVKQRQESAKAYDEGGRADLAQKERTEIALIEEFLPRQLSAEEAAKAIEAAIAATGAASIKDMGRVMAELKTKYTGQMDFGAVGPMVKAKLG